eukprot:CAMPEP_0204318230 /NCGR_PEP_ID=MMETSP0469-20131031/6421_1 /ASSEMBLY_ACC=CAM_ASM_000384 /TAXON_ID=2969 /ORGANISM="Oxyrrhis marina" /LENGTH=171 /DNA_ID=CAMNT_0051299259 /DNA_START=242 /DNA_END=754 /DNA_ORIENTATION=+
MAKGTAAKRAAGRLAVVLGSVSVAFVSSSVLCPLYKHRGPPPPESFRVPLPLPYLASPGVVFVRSVLGTQDSQLGVLRCEARRVHPTPWDVLLGRRGAGPSWRGSRRCPQRLVEVRRPRPEAEAAGHAPERQQGAEVGGARRRPLQIQAQPQTFGRPWCPVLRACVSVCCG